MYFLLSLTKAIVAQMTFLSRKYQNPYIHQEGTWWDSSLKRLNYSDPSKSFTNCVKYYYCNMQMKYFRAILHSILFNQNMSNTCSFRSSVHGVFATPCVDTVSMVALIRFNKYDLTTHSPLPYLMQRTHDIS